MAYERTYIEAKLRRWEDYLQRFSLPGWEELPDTGLRMVEVVAYIHGRLDYLPEELKDEHRVTAAAINNYVRLRAMPKPRQRRYYRVHLAYLLMICSMKQSLSLSMINRLLPFDLAEDELRVRYETYVDRCRCLTAEFANMGLERSLPILEELGGEAGARRLIESAVVVSNFARLMAEKLLLLEDDNG